MIIKKSDHKEKSYNDVTTAYNKKPTSFYNKPAAYNDKPTAYNDRTTAYNNKPTAYNDKPTTHNKYHHIRQLWRSTHSHQKYIVLFLVTSFDRSFNISVQSVYKMPVLF